MVAALAFTSLLVAGSAGAGSSHTAALAPIKYSTSFGTFGREAYAYVALEKGYFRDAGLDVSITPGTGTVNVATLISSGQVDYGPGDTTAMVLARANGGLPVKCVALIHQKTLSAYFVRADSGINTWKDFEGKTIGDTAGSTGTVLFPMTAKKAGVDASKVKFVPTTPQTGPGLFASKRIDIFAQFVVGQPVVRAANGGDPVRSFKVADMIPGLGGNCLMVSDSKLRSNPAEVKKFTGALLKGLQWSLDNPGAAGAILQKHVPLADYKLAAAELRIMRKFSRDAATRRNGLGYIDPKRMDATASIVNNFFKPKNRVTRADIFAPGFLPAKPLR
jgi:NitT/TauT family transport system substrate-binding protein